MSHTYKHTQIPNTQQHNCILIAPNNSTTLQTGRDRLKDRHSDQVWVTHQTAGIQFTQSTRTNAPNPRNTHTHENIMGLFLKYVQIQHHLKIVSTRTHTHWSYARSSTEEEGAFNWHQQQQPSHTSSTFVWVCGSCEKSKRLLYSFVLF